MPAYTVRASVFLADEKKDGTEGCEDIDDIVKKTFNPLNKFLLWKTSNIGPPLQLSFCLFMNSSFLLFKSQNFAIIFA